MEYPIDEFKKIVDVNEKSISALLLYLSCIEVGDRLITPAGKIVKSSETGFQIFIDDEVIDKASSIILGDEFNFEE